MSKKYREKLNKKQKEVIAEQLADFFFDFWMNKTNKKNKRVIINRNGKAVVSDLGLLRNFPEDSETTT